MTRGRSKPPVSRRSQPSRGRGAASSTRSSAARPRLARRARGGYAAALAAVSVVGLLLVGRVSFAAHMLLVPHLIGADGKLLHESPHEEARARSDAYVALPSGPAASIADDGDPERCDVVAVTEAPPATTTSPAPSHLLLWRSLAGPVPPGVDGATIALLLLAPKLSPPR